MKLYMGWATTTGSRPDNQDRAVGYSLKTRMALIVADGAGGHPCGAETATAIVRTQPDLTSHAAPLKQRAEHWAEKAQLAALAAGGVSTGLAFLGDAQRHEAYLVACGDSTVQRYRAGTWMHLTQRQGYGNVLGAYFGQASRRAFDPQFISLMLIPGDLYVLYTDGCDAFMGEKANSVLRPQVEQAIHSRAWGFAARNCVEVAKGLSTDNCTLGIIYVR